MATPAPTTTAPVPASTPADMQPASADFWAGVNLHTIAPCCAKGNGTANNMTLAEWNATAPSGTYLPPDVQGGSPTIGHCHVGGGEVIDIVLMCLLDATTDPHLLVTYIFPNGTVFGFPKEPSAATATSMSTTAAATSASKSSGTSAYGRLGLISLLAMAAAAIVTL
ncbi:uncharacterized protein LOC62_02G001865 [Vanrija pseudolonga]|uniref:Uncharacterized protein n=1 Tax=Vanrija pseudolonga TaxID=143232 RepID=A0AAF0Y1B3_9TREE|nr:hypothetical protein LOC62_02G001865 [Vanrija pseudolonga]